MSKKKLNISIDRREELKKIQSKASAFRDFISRGNVVDMAVGVIVGGSFGKIVTSLVNDILMPLFGVVLGGLNFSGLNFKVGDATIAYGVFIQTIIDFLIISFCIFLMISFFERFKRKEVESAKERESKKSDEVLLLEEIRDLLKQNKENF